MKRILPIISLVVALFGSAHADEKKFGRLADGRAYRVDDQGLQMIDQLAELQVTVDELNRQVDTLEYELAEKDRALLQQGKGVVTTVRPGAAAEAAAVLPPARMTDSCRGEIESYQTKLIALESQLRATHAQGQTACDYESQTRPLREQIAMLQQTLKSTTSGQPIGNSEEEQTRRALQISLAQQQDKLTERDVNLRDAQASSSALSQKLAETETLLASARRELEVEKRKGQDRLAQPDTIARGRMAPEATTVTPQLGGPEIASAKKSLNKALAEIQQLVLKRKDLYDARKSQKKSISISLQPLVAKNGVSLDTYRSRISRLSPSDSVQSLQRGLEEISGILNDDISTLKRLGRL